jgi:hypothetical protein
VRRLALLTAIGLASLLAVSLFLTHGRLEVKASVKALVLTSNDALTVTAELRNVGFVTVHLSDPTCEPIQIRVSNSVAQTIWETHTACPLMAAPIVVEVKPGQSLSRTQCIHYVNSPGSCMGFFPALPIGHYALTGTFYGQPFSALSFEIVGANT